MWNKSAAPTKKNAPFAVVVYLPPAPPRGPGYDMPWEKWYRWVLVNEWQAFVCTEKRTGEGGAR